MRRQTENFSQGRNGNVLREPGEIISQDGNYEDDTVISESGDFVLYEMERNEEVYLEELVFLDTSAAANTIQLLDATLNDDGSVDTTTPMTVPEEVSASSKYTEDGYTGEPFTEDAIVINVSGSGEARVGLHSSYKEYEEPAAEQTEVA